MDSLSDGNYVDEDISERRWSFKGNTIVAHVQQEQKSNPNYCIIKIVIIYLVAWCPVEILMFPWASLLHSSFIPPPEEM